MPASDHAPRLGFLKDSAGSLNSLSPSTAAHLLMVHNQILHEEFKPLNQRQLDFACGACGSIRDPTTSKTIQIKKKKSKRADSSAAKALTGGATVYKCLRCRRRTVKPTVRSSTSSRPGPTSLASSSTQTTASTTVSTGPASDGESLDINRSNKSVENMSSKKRAKARKAGGLQALLASKQQTQSKPSQSLDLFDFLQQ